MGHDFGQAVIVIAFDPHHFDVTFGVGKLANEAQKFPVLFFQTSEIEVGKNIAQQDEAAISIFPQNTQGFAGAAHVCAEVQIRKDQRVVNLRCDVLRCDGLRYHGLNYCRGLLRGDESGTRWQARGNLLVTCP